MVPAEEDPKYQDRLYNNIESKRSYRVLVRTWYVMLV